MQICSTCGDFIRQDADIFFKAVAESIQPLPVCGNCTSDVPIAAVEQPDLTSAWLMGLFAGILAVFLWFGVVVLTQTQFALISILIGWVVGKAVLRGAGHRPHFTLQLMSVGITVVTMVLSEYLITRFFSVADAARSNRAGATVFYGRCGHRADRLSRYLTESDFTYLLGTRHVASFSRPRSPLAVEVIGQKRVRFRFAVIHQLADEAGAAV